MTTPSTTPGADSNEPKSKTVEGSPLPDSSHSRGSQPSFKQVLWENFVSIGVALLLVFGIRSTLVEAFKIPSGSMIPTLHIGDLILVNKFHYGIRLPVLNIKVLDNNPVQRGDVMVFRYPPKPSLDYIKRVVGVPGDKLAYFNKVLTINGQLVSKASVPEFFDADTMRYSKQFEEAMPIGSTPADMNKQRAHRVLNDDRVPNFVSGIN
jgi:signal peptidase I